jgi:hypothetical protein
MCSSDLIVYKLLIIWGKIHVYYVDLIQTKTLNFMYRAETMFNMLFSVKYNVSLDL